MATYLSAKSTVYFAPAMDLDMYQHDTTKKNIAELNGRGHKMIPPGTGELASGLEGEGRMAEPEEILHFIEEDLRSGLPLLGKKVLITAGPTYEAIDPVRFIGNHSSGKMGYSLAEEAARLGAQVYLISGPTSLPVGHPGIEKVSVVSAEEMYVETHRHVGSIDIAIFSAAVSDFKPKKVSSEKIKKTEETLTLDLVRTKDILASVGAIKRQDQFLVGFALETENELENAKAKLNSKNLDMIVLNSLRDKGAGFKSDTNKISILVRDGQPIHFELKEKPEVAQDIFNEIIKSIHV